MGTTGRHGTQEAAGETQRVLVTMFTAGNMTYMRKRKKEKQAAKRAMAREKSRNWPRPWRRRMNQLLSFTTFVTTEGNLNAGHTPPTRESNPRPHIFHPQEK